MAAINAFSQLISWATGTDVGIMASIWGLIGLVLIIVVPLIGVRSHRTATVGTEGDYSFMTGLVEALKINGVSVVIGYVWGFVYYSFVNTDFTTRQKAAMIEFMEKAGTPEETIEKSLKDLDKTPIEQMFSPTALAFIIGIVLIFSLIVAAITRREKKVE